MKLCQAPHGWVAWGCLNTASRCCLSHGVLLVGCFQPCTFRPEGIVCDRGLAGFVAAVPHHIMDMAASAVQRGFELVKQFPGLLQSTTAH